MLNWVVTNRLTTSLESKVTEGIINSLSGIGGDLSLLQISSPIQPGNSGGPLISEYGSVVGVVVSKLGRKFNELAGYSAENVGYAINVAKLQGLIEITRNIQVAPRRQISDQPLTTVDIVSMSESSVVMIISSSKKLICEGNLPQLSIAQGSQWPRTEQDIINEREQKAKEERQRLEARQKEIEKQRKEDEQREVEKQKQEAKKRVETKRLQKENVTRAFFDALSATDRRWERVYESPGFKKWATIGEGEIGSIFTNHEEIDPAVTLVSSYLKHTREVYKLGETEKLSDTQIFLGGIELQYAAIGSISEVNRNFKYIVSTADRKIPISKHIWFYHQQLNDWVSLKVSKAGDGWISASLPSEMVLPNLNSTVYIAE